MGCAPAMSGPKRCAFLGYELCDECKWLLLFPDGTGTEPKVDRKRDRAAYRSHPCANKLEPSKRAQRREGMSKRDAERLAAAANELTGLAARGPHDPGAASSDVARALRGDAAAEQPRAPRKLQEQEDKMPRR